jgi:hypothetical protein
MIVRPQGILGHREFLTLLPKRWRLGVDAPPAGG